MLKTALHFTKTLAYNMGKLHVYALRYLDMAILECNEIAEGHYGPIAKRFASERKKEIEAERSRRKLLPLGQQY
ncbi:hypothetical protein [Hymenobacter metallicola]|uniref:Uncharacterized protein n=1 Tax=Hymenobacter metallicola TaxID=2563114 RepID=A0A4Z0QJW3_9BACT|nr:hypothetical protein [Hymenobacter metallicola]TGE29796.1 hypothetical protein E5K02_10155 [Hymenobacter metallicola]